MKAVFLLALVAFATALPSLPMPTDVQTMIEDAKKSVMNSDHFDEDLKKQLLALLDSPNAAELVLPYLPVFDFPSFREAEDPAERCIFALALLIDALIQSLTTTTVAPPTTV